MRDSILGKAAWRRRGVRRPYVGTLVADEEGIRLSGRDPVSGIEVSLSIPLSQVDSVRVARPGEELLAVLGQEPAPEPEEEAEEIIDEFRVFIEHDNPDDFAS